MGSFMWVPIGRDAAAHHPAPSHLGPGVKPRRNDHRFGRSMKWSLAPIFVAPAMVRPDGGSSISDSPRTRGLRDPM